MIFRVLRQQQKSQYKFVYVIQYN